MLTGKRQAPPGSLPSPVGKVLWKARAMASRLEVLPLGMIIPDHQKHW